MKYQLIKNDCVLTNKLFYDKELANCAGKDIRVCVTRVKDPIPVVELKYRYMENTGYFNIYLANGSSVNMINITKLLIETKG